MKLANEVRELRDALIEAGLTQRSAARRLGINHQYLNRILKGVDKPGPDLIQAMASLASMIKRSGLIAV